MGPRGSSTYPVLRLAQQAAPDQVALRLLSSPLNSQRLGIFGALSGERFVSVRGRVPLGCG
jgi:hypothetical protein